MLEERARGAGMRLAERFREALLAAPVEPAAGSVRRSGEGRTGEKQRKRVELPSGGGAVWRINMAAWFMQKVRA